MGRNDPAETLDANTFVVVVGRDWKGGGKAAVEARFKAALHKAVVDWLDKRVSPVRASRAADLIVADKASEHVVYLTAARIGEYLRKARTEE